MMDVDKDYEIISVINEVNEDVYMKTILINSFELKKQIVDNNNSFEVLPLISNNEINEKVNQKKEDNKENKEDEKVSGWTKVKFKCDNLKNQIKYNSFDLNTIKIDKSNHSTLHFFNKKYHMDNPKEKQELNNCLKELIYFSYRKNFPIIVNYNTNKKYSSDCGWGCMIRSAQMLLSRALFKYFRTEMNKLHHSIMYSLFFFLDKPLKMNEMPDVYSHMIKKYLECKPLQPNLHLYSIFPPFSIQTLIQVGQFLGKNAGEFYSDIHMARIFSLINTHMNIIPNFSIAPVQNALQQRDILNNCFTKEERLSGITEYKGEKYYFNKCGLFLVSMRLGLKKISSSYFNSIKDIFKCNQCIGLIGGKNISAFYFIGYDKDHLFYLDPHRSQDSIEDTSNYETYLKKSIHKIKIESMQTALTAGFLILSIEDYNEMVAWIEKHEKKEFRCLTLSRKSFNGEDYETSKTDDF